MRRLKEPSGKRQSSERQLNIDSSKPMPRKTRKRWLIFTAVIMALLASLVAMRFRAAKSIPPTQPVAAVAPRSIACLGRIEPDFEVITLAAPSSNSAQPPLIAALKIEEGDEVKAGQLIATLDNRDRLERAWQAAVSQIKVAEQRLAQIKAGPKPADLAAQRAEISRLQAELGHAEIEYGRAERLYQHGDVAATEIDARRVQRQTQEQLLRQAEERLRSLAEVREVDVNYAQAEVEAAVAEARRTKAEYDQAFIYSPINGRVVKIHARPGEQIVSSGLAELAKSDRMYAVAEVYESDINRVKAGQRATVSCDAVTEKLTGKVDRIGMRAVKNTVLSPNPASFSDARVVEVKVLLDEPQKVIGLINARVTVSIEP
jgi:HlyD family secretion protein